MVLLLAGSSRRLVDDKKIVLCLVEQENQQLGEKLFHVLSLQLLHKSQRLKYLGSLLD